MVPIFVNYFQICADIIVNPYFTSKAGSEGVTVVGKEPRLKRIAALSHADKEVRHENQTKRRRDGVTARGIEEL